MGNRIFVSVVFLLWASTMSWLVVAKILPPFYNGEPPQPSLQSDEVVAWRIRVEDRPVGRVGDGPIGWAMSQAVSGVSGTRELHSRVLLDGLPVKEMAPDWMESLVSNLGPVDLDARTQLTFDSLGQLASLETKIGLNGVPAVLRMWGRVEQSQVNLKLQTGDVIHETCYPIAEKTFVSGELMPEARLSRMYVGRKWQRRIVSLFGAPTSAMETLQAEVVEEEVILQNGRSVNVRRIEYRTLSAPGVASKNTLRAVLWVSDDGTVLREDVFVMNVRLRFERVMDEESLKYAEEMLDIPSVSANVTRTGA